MAIAPPRSPGGSEGALALFKLARGFARLQIGIEQRDRAHLITLGIGYREARLRCVEVLARASEVAPRDGNLRARQFQIRAPVRVAREGGDVLRLNAFEQTGRVIQPARRNEARRSRVGHRLRQRRARAECGERLSVR